MTLDALLGKILALEEIATEETGRQCRVAVEYNRLRPDPAGKLSIYCADTCYDRHWQWDTASDLECLFSVVLAELIKR